MESLKFHAGPPCPTLLRHPLQLFQVARPQGGRLAAIFYPIGHLTPMHGSHDPFLASGREVGEKRVRLSGEIPAVPTHRQRSRRHRGIHRSCIDQGKVGHGSR
jgi:hypothetical protein